MQKRVHVHELVQDGSLAEAHTQCATVDGRLIFISCTLACVYDPLRLEERFR